MPILATLIGNLFASATAFIALMVGKKMAVGIVGVAGLSVLTISVMVAVTACINEALAAFSAAIAALPLFFLVGFSLFMPSFFVEGISCVVAVQIAIALYHWNVANVKLLATAS